MNPLRWTVLETIIAASILLHVVFFFLMGKDSAGNPIIPPINITLLPGGGGLHQRKPPKENSSGEQADLTPGFNLLQKWKGEEAYKIFQDRLDKEPDDTMALSGRGMALMHMKHFDRALKDFNRVVELSPESYRSYSNRGDAYSKLRRYREAIQDYEKVIEMIPADPLGYFNRGKVRLRMDQYDKALADFNRAMECGMTEAVLNSNRGTAYRGLGRNKEAEAEFRTVLKKDPGMISAHWALASIYMEQDKPDKALAELNKAIQADPEFQKDMFFREWYHTTNPYLDRGGIYFEKDDFTRALQDFNSSLRVFPGHSMALYERGFCYQRIGKMNLAREDFREWLKKDRKSNKDVEPEDLAFIFYITGNYKRAVEEYSRCIDNDGSKAEFLLFRGMAYKGLGDNKSAQRDLQEALNKGLDDSEAKEAQRILKEMK